MQLSTPCQCRFALIPGVISCTCMPLLLQLIIGDLFFIVGWCDFHSTEVTLKSISLYCADCLFSFVAEHLKTISPQLRFHYLLHLYYVGVLLIEINSKIKMLSCHMDNSSSHGIESHLNLLL